MPDTQPDEQTLSAAVTEAYDLPPPIRLTRVHTGPNDVYRLRAGDGDRALKLYRAGWGTQERVRDEVAALRHLEQRGAAIAAPIAGRDGEYVRGLALPDGERQLVLFAEARGQPAPVLSGSFCSVCTGRSTRGERRPSVASSLTAARPVDAPAESKARRSDALIAIGTLPAKVEFN
jgi:hypothetical protein